VCDAAAVMVLSDCSEECGGCTAVAAGCIGSETDLIVKRFEEMPAKTAETVSQQIGGYVSMVGMAFIVLSGVILVARRARSGKARVYSDVLLEDELVTDA